MQLEGAITALPMPTNLDAHVRIVYANDTPFLVEPVQHEDEQRHAENKPDNPNEDRVAAFDHHCSRDQLVPPLVVQLHLRAMAGVVHGDVEGDLHRLPLLPLPNLLEALATSSGLSAAISDGADAGSPMAAPGLLRMPPAPGDGPVEVHVLQRLQDPLFCVAADIIPTRPAAVIPHRLDTRVEGRQPTCQDNVGKVIQPVIELPLPLEHRVDVNADPRLVLFVDDLPGDSWHQEPPQQVEWEADDANDQPDQPRTHPPDVHRDLPAQDEEPEERIDREATEEARKRARDDEAEARVDITRPWRFWDHLGVLLLRPRRLKVVRAVGLV
mmetsp:Transcript_118301/g.342002  ORF Transcript_118301/g.342002 Transcript_118301/m.342002 type:complete len:327 (-) Transcript_118301:364-1344(-)